MNSTSSSRHRLWRVVDASVWVSRYVTADVNHAASRAWLYQYLRAGNVVVAPTLLLVEVAGALARHTGDTRRTEEIVRRLRQLPGVRQVTLTAELRDHAVHLAATLLLHGADVIYIALADRLRIPLVTWDREQLIRAQPLIVIRTP